MANPFTDFVGIDHVVLPGSECSDRAIEWQHGFKAVAGQQRKITPHGIPDRLEELRVFHKARYRYKVLEAIVCNHPLKQDFAILPFLDSTRRSGACYHEMIRL